jgi:hypothetical protein
MIKFRYQIAMKKRRKKLLYHEDYLIDAGVLSGIKKANSLEFMFFGSPNDG